MWRWSRPIAASFRGGWSAMADSKRSGSLDRDGPALAGGAQHGIDEVVDPERLAAAHARAAILLDRIEEVGEQRAMGVVRERHRIGAAAGALLLAEALLAAVVPVQRHHPSRENRGRSGADQLDPLGEAGILRRGRDQRTVGAVRETQTGGREVFGLHAVQAG